MINKKKVLLVEDQKIVQLFCKAAIEDIGFTVDVADTGNDAIKMSSTTRYDFIFMDIGLPDISGIEATKKIRGEGKEGGSKNSPIVAFTAHDTEEYRKKAEEAGLNDFLTKPISEEGFRKVLKKFQLL